jgi:hypothetical protein
VYLEAFDIKKIVKIILVVILIIVGLQATLFVGARYGWRLFGFEFCQPTSSLYTNNIKINDNNIEIQGGTTYSAPAFVGYIDEISGNTLYIGMKYNLLFGLSNRIGNFNIKLNCDTKNISKICFKDKTGIKVIWDKQNVN